MTTQTLGTTGGPDQRAADGGNAAAPGWRTLADRSGLPLTRRAGIPVVVWSVFFRSVVLLADGLLALTTVLTVIPMIGAGLYQQVGATQVSLTPIGTIAMWLMPFCFLVILLAAGEIAAMRAMWRWSSRVVQRIRSESLVSSTSPGSEMVGKSTTSTRKEST